MHNRKKHENFQMLTNHYKEKACRHITNHKCKIEEGLRSTFTTNVDNKKNVKLNFKKFKF